MSQYTEWGEALEKELAQPFPEEWVQTKTLQGTAIAFVPWYRYVERLNEVVGGGWSMGAPIIQDIAGKLVMGVPVTVFGVTRINFGDENDDTDSYGTAATNAFAQAFKRTCAMFGMGLDMYSSGKPQRAPSQGQSNGRPAGAPQPSGIECPKCGGDMWDNREDKPSPKHPDFKCKNKNCKDVVTGYTTAYWWDRVVEEVRTLMDTASGAELIDVDFASTVEQRIEERRADRVFGAIRYLSTELEKARVGAATAQTTEGQGGDFDPTVPQDDLPF